MRVNANYMKETKMTKEYHLKKLAHYIDDATKIIELEFEFNTTENDENGTPIKNTIRLPLI